MATDSFVQVALLLCFRSQGFTHLFLEPTIPLIDDVALPKWNEVLDKYGIPHTFKASPRPTFSAISSDSAARLKLGGAVIASEALVEWPNS